MDDLKMPSYKYKCHRCGNEVTIVCSIKDYSSTTYCDNCNELIERKPEDLVSNYTDTVGFYGKTSKQGR